MKKRGWIIAGLVLVALIGYFVWQYMAPATPNAPKGNVMIEGEITCLPDKDSLGPHTLECAIGLVDDQKHYYALRDLPEQTVPNSIRVRVEGMLASPPADERYDIKGIITVTKLTKL